MKSVLVICFSDLRRDARVMRQINFLKSEYRVEVAAFGALPDEQYVFHKLEKTRLTFLRKAVSSVFLLLGFHAIAYTILHHYSRYVAGLRDKNFDLIVANDAETLPIAFKIANGRSKVFFDAHEYAPRQFEDRLYWRIFFRRFNVYLCKKYIPRVSGMSTINQSLARAYEENFGIRSVITTNAPAYVDWSPQPRNQLPIRLVHHGIFTVSRQPEIMIDLMELLDERFTLDLIYMVSENASSGTKQYFENFKARVAATKKIRVLPALKPAEIVPFLHAHYDVGIILVPPINFNYENGLPNKLFDCIQARVSLCVGPLKEIARVTNDYDVGIVSPDFTAYGMAHVLQTITLDDINRFKKNTDAAAKQLNAEYNKTLLLEALKKIV